MSFQILIDGNPVKLNENCDLIIREILTVVKIKNNLKKPSQRGQISTIYTTPRGKQRSTTTLNIAVPKININPEAGTSQNENEQTGNLILSAPNQSTFLRRKATTMKKLRANNVLIEQDEFNDQLLSEDTVSTRAPIGGSLNVTQSMMLSSSFDSNKVQNELANLKKMRQNYGTDWLLSTQTYLPKLATANTNNSNTQEANLSKKDDTSIKNNDDINMGIVIESFAVYRSIEASILDLNNFGEKADQARYNDADGESENDTTRSICILNLTDEYLIEKDETNSNLLCFNRFTDLADMSILENDQNSR